MIWKLGKFVRKVAVLLLWLAVIIVMAHSVVPHDHHTEFSVSIPDTSCNAHENRPGNHHPLPIHCRAFNDLVCEKYTFSFLNFRIHLIVTSLSPLI